MLDETWLNDGDPVGGMFASATDEFDHSGFAGNYIIVHLYRLNKQSLSYKTWKQKKSQKNISMPWWRETSMK